MNGKPPRLVLALLASLLAAGSAWGFAYLVNDSTGLPIKWPATPVRVRLMLGTSPGGVDYNAAATAAATEWNNLMGSLQINPQPATGTAGDRNTVNEMAFAANVFGEAFDNNVLAVTTTWHRGNERTEADIIFNTARTWGVYNGPTQGNVVDLRRVALHELGHALGLDHPDEAGQSFAPPLPIMNSRITGNDTLTADDITAVQNLYGPPGTPGNDNFASATLLILPTENVITVSGYTNNATKQGGEPSHADNAGGRSIWWRWTAPAPGPVTLDTRGSYSDTLLAVYTGTALNSLAAVASNDDINPGIVQASSLTFNATAGTTYFIAVDGFNHEGIVDTSAITLRLGFTPTAAALPVITSQPASATVAAGGTASFTVAATGATSYQWFFNNGSIGGATGVTHTVTNAQAANTGSYFVRVTNANGSLNSDTVTLTVNLPPPPPTPPPSSGGGGGGATSLWFYGALSLLVLARFIRRR